MKSDRTREKGKGNVIGQLEEHTLGYYRRVSEMLKQDFDSAEERGGLLSLCKHVARYNMQLNMMLKLSLSVGWAYTPVELRIVASCAEAAIRCRF